MPQPVGLLKLVLNLFRTISIQGRELYSRDFIRMYTFFLGLLPDAYEPISFELDTILDTTVLMTLIFTQAHMLTRQNFRSHSVVKWQGTIQTFATIDHVGEMTAKKFPSYGEYGSFECLLFLLILLSLPSVVFSYSQK